ncbi:MAG: 2-iminoacetate synthase ThiH [Acidaminobacteraceae bacterium]
MKKHEVFFDENVLNKVSSEEIEKVLHKSNIDKMDFLKLLTYKDLSSLEKCASKSHEESVKHFGKAVLLYAPLYIANKCVNRCVYCSFNESNNLIKRIKLTTDEIIEEAKELSSMGIKHVLLLTGEEEKESGFIYVNESVKILRQYFDSIMIEVAPLDQSHYEKLIDSGVDGVTIYQEVYDKEIYKKIHIKGPKADYRYRLDTPERACRADIRSVNLGALIGLGDWRREIFLLGMHIKYICEKYPHIEVGISLPRIKGIQTSEKLSYDLKEINDTQFLQALTALRLLVPHCAINISTRESSEFRKNLIPIGVNKMSAGVSTSVGGYKVNRDDIGQFDISDKSSVEDVKKLIESVGYQSIFKDWMSLDK